jgi:hypothetical protein
MRPFAQIASLDLGSGAKEFVVSFAMAVRRR